jgi:hypothetical protein
LAGAGILGAADPPHSPADTATHAGAFILSTSSFYGETPDDRGCEAAWPGRDVMRALMALQRQQPLDRTPGTRHDRHDCIPPAAQDREFHRRQCHRPDDRPGSGGPGL